jgi:hypothetical protein
MELRLCELKLNVKALFDPHLHPDGRIQLRLLLLVEHYEFFFLRNLGVLSVDDYIDVVAHPAHYPIVSLKLLLAPIELEWVSRIVCQ